MIFIWLPSGVIKKDWLIVCIAATSGEIKPEPFTVAILARHDVAIMSASAAFLPRAYIACKYSIHRGNSLRTSTSSTIINIDS